MASALPRVSQWYAFDFGSGWRQCLAFVDGWQKENGENEGYVKRRHSSITKKKRNRKRVKNGEQPLHFNNVPYTDIFQHPYIESSRIQFWRWCRWIRKQKKNSTTHSKLQTFWSQIKFWSHFNHATINQTIIISWNICSARYGISLRFCYALKSLFQSLFYCEFLCELYVYIMYMGVDILYIGVDDFMMVYHIIKGNECRCGWYTMYAPSY